MQLRKIFDQVDTSNDGVISFEEFEAAMKKMNYPMDQIQAIFDSIDVNRNGKIMYTEFIAAALNAHGHIEEERIAEAFDRLDSDDSGYISKQNLRDFLGKEGTMERINELMKEADMDNDGKISYPEFLKMFRQQTSSLIDQVTRFDSTGTSVHDGSLVGIDAKIPGGKYDSEIVAKAKAR